jgi:hypothetical protein
MNSNYLYPGSDLEGDARESADLKVGLKMPEIKRRPMPVMSDMGAVPQAWCARWPASQLRPAD